MRNTLSVCGALLLLALTAAGCGDDNQRPNSNEELGKRLTKLEDDLHEARRKQIAEQEAIRQLNQRLRDVEMKIDKAEYQASRPR